MVKFKGNFIIKYLGKKDDQIVILKIILSKLQRYYFRKLRRNIKIIQFY
jgi:hypothetical protein